MFSEPFNMRLVNFASHEILRKTSLFLFYSFSLRLAKLLQLAKLGISQLGRLDKLGRLARLAKS